MDRSSSLGVRVAVDIGGTFTDLQVLLGASGQVFEIKTPTTPDDPSVGLVTGLNEASSQFGFALDEIEHIVHGTTIATNAVLERKLPRGALITTKGFTDVLEIGRHLRKDVYSLTPEPRTVLIARRDRFGLTERMAAGGTPEVPVDEAEVAALADEIARREIGAIAACLINAHANPAHERQVGALLQARLPALPISLSSEISPEVREYERTSTVVLNALLRPTVARYIADLQERLAQAGIGAQLYLVQSNGGVCAPDIAAREPARLLLSGPSGGTAAACRIAADLTEPGLIAVDMGGTSFDVSVVHHGRTTTVTEGEIEGCPVRLPMVEIRTVGAGGGSLARIEAGGRLRVGPESAGADPGPASYAKGGERATVTDAHIALGRIDPAFFLGGRMALDVEAARGAIARDVAEPLALSVEQAAEGIVAVTNANLATAIRLSLFEKGLDPLDFALLSFGGAGGLHAAAVAEEMGIGRVIFPRSASTLSAYGLLWSDIVHDLVSACLAPADSADEPVSERIARLTEEAEAKLSADNIDPANRSLDWALDMRYRGQAFELSVPLSAAGSGGPVMTKAVRDFHAVHEQRFAYSQLDAPVEVVALRLAAKGSLPNPDQTPAARAGGGEPSARKIFLDGDWREVAVYRDAALEEASELMGPLIVEQAYTTILLPAGWRARASAFGDLIATNVGAVS